MRLRCLPNRVGLAVVLAVVLRAGLMAAAGFRFEDRDNYLPLARSVAAGHGLEWRGRWTAYRPPLYPILLAPVVGLLGDRAELGVAVLHLLLGAGTTWLTARAARSLGGDDRESCIAALIVACDPVLAVQSRYIMTETPTAFLLALVLTTLARPGFTGAALSGFASGLAALTRPSVLPGFALAALAAMVTRPGSGPSRIQWSAVYLGTLLATLAPWALRNALVLGEPVWTTTHGGYTLALANNPTYYHDVLEARTEQVWTGRDQWLWWDKVNTETALLSEPEADRYLRNQALAFAWRHPRLFLRAAVDRQLRFWSVAPSGVVYSRLVRLAVACWTIPLWIALIAGLLTPASWRWPKIAAVTFIFGLGCVHLVYWTDLRMRAPLVPAIAVLAAQAGSRRIRADLSAAACEAAQGTGRANRCRFPSGR